MDHTTLVAPDLWRITTPLPFRPRSVHAYLTRLESGWMLVDGGVDTGAAWEALKGAVEEIAGGWEELTVHVVTHMHMDHIGLARRVRGASGATLAMGVLDARRAEHAHANPGEEAEYREVLLRESGAPREVLEALQAARRDAAPLAPYAPVDRVLEGQGGELVHAWSFLWTPGHTAGHVSLLREDGVLIAGDAVLPTISPTIGVNRQREDPVQDYVDALQRVESAHPRIVLPGHGEPILEPPSRIEELRSATGEETEQVRSLLSEAPVSAWELAERRYAGRELPVPARIQALRETLAHLRHLVKRGEAGEEARGFRLPGGG